MINDNDYSNNYEFIDSFDASKFFGIFNRNKKIFAFLTLISIFFGGVLSFALKKTWEGEFQIVLEAKDNQNKSLLSRVGNIDIAKIAERANPLGFDKKTEVAILKSPSVLMDVYDFVIKEKSKKGSNSINFDFKKWKKA